MPIIRMASRREDVPEGARDVAEHSERCAVSAYRPDGTFTYWTYQTHHGLCLEDRERNGYDDSDFYMIVWNPETEQPEQIEYATTRGWSYPCYGSSVDATPDVRAAYEAYGARMREEARLRRLKEERATPAKGKLLKVVRGKHAGTVGPCMWVGIDRYASSRNLEVYRVGLQPPGAPKPLFVAMDYVVVLDGAEELTPPHTARITRY